MQRHWRRTVIIGIAACLMASGCNKDEGPRTPAEELRFPASWAGVWRVNSPYRDCQTDSLLGVDVYVDSLCAGETLQEFLGIPAEQIVVECAGTITDTEFSAHCSGYTEELGVVLTITADFTATRQDSVFNGGGTAILRYQIGDDSTTDCYEVSFEAALQAPASPDCVAGTATRMAKPLARAMVQRPLLRP